MKPYRRFSRVRVSVLAAAVLTAAALGGCGSDADDDGAQADDVDDAASVSQSPADEESEPEAEPESPSPTPEPTTPEPTPEPTPEFTPLAPEDAADGTDVDACADGECEVAVTAGTVIPFDPEVGGVTIADVGRNDVTLTMTYSSGGSGVMQVGVGPRSGSFGNVNTMIIEFGVLGIEDGTAVMSFAPGNP